MESDMSTLDQSWEGHLRAKLRARAAIGDEGGGDVGVGGGFPHPRGSEGNTLIEWDCSVLYTQNKKRTILSLKKEPMLHILNNPLESQLLALGEEPQEKGSFVT